MLENAAIPGTTTLRRWQVSGTWACLSSTVLAGACGLSWSSPWHWIGPTLSLLLIPLVILQRNAWQRYLVALGYYLAGSHGIPLASGVFFGSGSTGEGVFLWLGSSALLSAGWTFCNRPWKAAVVLLFDAIVPPLSFFDWMSPLTAAGVLFPGTGWIGLVLLLLAIGTFWTRHHSSRGLLGNALLVAALSFASYLLFLGHPAVVPTGWKGLNLRVGPSQESILKNDARLTSWVAAADSQKARVLLLPETLLSWWKGSADFVQDHVPPGTIWLVGASSPLPKGYFADGIEEVRNSGSRLLFASALPVPVSMWMPWRSPQEGRKHLRLLHVPGWMVPQQYKAIWWSSAQRVNGRMVWANICYDQLLPFVWIEGAIQKPQIVLLTNNEWWAHGTGIPQIQAASSWAWSRLIGAATIKAENY